MVEELRGGRVGAYLRRAGRTRVPLVTTDPRSRPIVARWPFLALAGAVAVLNLPVFAFTFGYGPAAIPVSVLLAVPVAIGRYRPMIGWVMGLVPLIAFPIHRLLFPEVLAPFPWLANQLAAHLPVIYLVALCAPRSVCYPAVAVTMIAGWSAVPQSSGYNTGLVVQGAVIWTLATVLAVVLGRARLQRRNAVIRIAEEQSRRRVLEERTRIARELHDVVAHHMSVIAVQASTAPYRIDPGSSTQVTQEFRTIGTSARDSLRELRQVLDVLRDAAEIDRPGLADLPRLIESTRLAGVPVRLIMDDPAPGTDAESAYVAYRIVQESLSNVIKHAGGAQTEVLITRGTAGVEIEVINEAPTATPHPAASGTAGSDAPPGHGLAGMRERAEAIGASLRVGPTESGGFRVAAVLRSTEPTTAKEAR